MLDGESGRRLMQARHFYAPWQLVRNPVLQALPCRLWDSWEGFGEREGDTLPFLSLVAGQIKQGSMRDKGQFKAAFVFFSKDEAKLNFS